MAEDKNPRTLYFVISASAVERDFSGVAVAGAVFPESDMIDDLMAKERERTEVSTEGRARRPN